MPASLRIASALVAVVATAAAAGAQTVAPSRAITIRPLPNVLARMRDSVGATLVVRVLSDGRAIVNDVSSRRLVLVDTTLSHVTVIADSAGGAGSYGSRPGGLIPYVGDSTLFVDATSSSFVVIDPNGKVARVMSAPRMQDVGFLTQPTNGHPGIDPAGRLVYRGIARNVGPFNIGPGGRFVPPSPPDSAPILRVDLATRKLDTATWIKIPKQRMNVVNLPNGGMTVSTILDPLPITDDWALLPDGTIAVVNGRDYHVEFVNADRTRTAAPKILFEWQRLSDEDKATVIDSAQKAAEEARAAAARRSGISAAPSAAPSAPGSSGPFVPPIVALSPSELPDYRPPFKSGSVRADRDGNLWIQTTAPKPPNGGLLVDVIDRKGELVDRIELPVGRSLAGVGSGMVYLAAKDSTGTHLERARIRD